jgi:hypothetical protein
VGQSFHISALQEDTQRKIWVWRHPLNPLTFPFLIFSFSFSSFPFRNISYLSFPLRQSFSLIISFIFPFHEYSVPHRCYHASTLFCKPFGGYWAGIQVFREGISVFGEGIWRYPIDIGRYLADISRYLAGIWENLTGIWRSLSGIWD